MASSTFEIWGRIYVFDLNNDFCFKHINVIQTNQPEFIQSVSSSQSEKESWWGLESFPKGLIQPSYHRGIAMLCALLDVGVTIDCGMWSPLSPFALVVKIRGNVWTGKCSYNRTVRTEKD